ncbi:hypothetical protein KFV96_27685, partial [Klebsiella pneumoniae]|nr:hypothetical protein [Klebsiella pneumoniae]
GSNIFNILLILGTSSVISPIVVESGLIVDFGFLIAITLLLYLVVFLNKQKEKKLTKLEGIIMVALYAGYIVYIISRN